MFGMKDYETEMKQICINLRKLMQNMKQEDILEKNLEAPLLRSPLTVLKTITQSLFMQQSYTSIATPIIFPHPNYGGCNVLILG